MTITLSDGKVTCNMDMMNYLSMILMEASEQYKAFGYHGLAAKAKEDADRIYFVLSASHYYDNI